MRLIHENSKKTIELHSFDDVSVNENILTIIAVGHAPEIITCMDNYCAEMIRNVVFDLFLCGWGEVWVHEYLYGDSPMVEYLMYP